MHLNAVARAKFVTKIDMTDAFEQIRIDPADVQYTAFNTIYGTYVSNVLQIGDLNGPSTMQRLMMYVFRDRQGRSVFIYLDDIFICSDTIEQHEDDLQYVLDQLKAEELYIAEHKLDLYAGEVECLGHVIDRKGIHADESKLEAVREWPRPQEWKDVERFLGLINYVHAFMPDVSAYCSILSGMCANGRQFVWRELHEEAFKTIKALATDAPILKPIDPKSAKTIWVITDASLTGAGAMLGQGTDWDTCRPAAFMSKKFTNAQRSYFTYEQETLAILEALHKWEDLLVGRPISIVTDHEALEFFKAKAHRNPRQIRWAQYLERFNYDVRYVEGTQNIVADALSRYYARDAPSQRRELHEYVHADVRLDRDGDDLPAERVAEARALLKRTDKEFNMMLGAITRAQTRRQQEVSSRSEAIKDRVEPREQEAAEMRAASSDPPEVPVAAGTLPIVVNEQSEPDLRPHVERGSSFMERIKDLYSGDPIFAKILAHPDHHSLFSVEDGLIYKTEDSRSLLCIPKGKVGLREAQEIVIDHAHRITAHKAAQRTAEYIKRFYWWPRVGDMTAKFCATCAVCARTKPANQRPQGLLHSLPLPTRPWQSIGMDFTGPLPESNGFDYILVVTCRLSSMCHLIPLKTTTTASELAVLYAREVVRLHGTPESIVSDRDSKFTSLFWKELQRILGTSLLMSTSFHPQTDGVSERKIRDVTTALRAVVAPDQKDWAEKLPMVEFALNSSLSQSTQMTPFEAGTGQLPAIGQTEVRGEEFSGVRDFAERAIFKYSIARDALLASRVIQTEHANRRRREGDPYEEGDKVYLSTENIRMPKGRAHKLIPRWIGPYEIMAAHPESSNYQLDLPDALMARGIHSVFHTSLLKRHEPNDEALFPGRENTDWFYDIGEPDEEHAVDAIIGHEWRGGRRPNLWFWVKWTDDERPTREPLRNVNRLVALDEYLKLQGAREVGDLSKRGRVPAISPQK